MYFFLMHLCHKTTIFHFFIHIIFFMTVVPLDYHLSLLYTYLPYLVVFQMFSKSLVIYLQFSFSFYLFFQTGYNFSVSAQNIICPLQRTLKIQIHGWLIHTVCSSTSVPWLRVCKHPVVGRASEALQRRLSVLEGN